MYAIPHTADKILAATRVDDATLNDGVIEINLPRLLGKAFKFINADDKILYTKSGLVR